MTGRRRIVDYATAVVLLAIPAALLRANLADPQRLTSFDNAVLRVSSPLQAGVSWVIEGIGGWWNGYVWLVDVADENEELRADNRRLRVRLAAAESRVAYAGELERLVGLRHEDPADTIGARVIGSSLNSHFRVARIRLDRGGKDVAVGMPVVAADGLVGRIYHAYGRYSDVLLATDPQSAVDVLIVRTGGRGVLTGLGEAASYRCKIEYLERDEVVREGDEVVTSGLGGAFPPGVAVGTIARVLTHDYGLFQEVEVEPAVDFSDLGRVLVVLSPPPPPDPNAHRRMPSERAYAARPYQ